jgi:hypothetical protein
MIGTDKPPLESLDLGGDRDEVDVIRAVAGRLSLSLDYSDAPTWVTVGDVFASVLKAAPPNRPQTPELWSHFAQVISEEADVDASRVRPETLLLAVPLAELLGRWLRRRLRPDR